VHFHIYVFEMGRYDHLKRAWKEAIKETIWLFNRHQPGPKKDICLFANRRGGSTWLMEVIAANRGVKFINEPLSVYSASSSQIEHLPVTDYNHLIHLDEEREQKVKTYLEKLFEGRLQARAPWAFWRPEFDLFSDRLVLKILSSKALIDWIDRTFDVHVMYFTRHPIPVALSIMRNDWDFTAKAYLNNNYFVEQWLSEEQYHYCWEIMETGPPLQQHVLNWALENLIPLRLLPERPHWTHVSYEEAVLHPEATIYRLSEALNLEDMERMKDKLHVPSRSTKKAASTIRDVKHGGARIQSWKAEVSDSDERLALEPLNRLGITLYRHGEVVPESTDRSSPEDAVL